MIESDGKTANAQHVLALDPFTLAVLRAHVEMLDSGTQGVRAGLPRWRVAVLLGEWQASASLTRSRGVSSGSPSKPGCLKSTCTTSVTATRPLAEMGRIASDATFPGKRDHGAAGMRIEPTAGLRATAFANPLVRACA